jgi:glucose-1-phosphate adenylyltransferase
MKRIHQNWYLGTADAVYQNMESIQEEKPEFTLILSGDHIYKMDYHDMLSWHKRKRADITIATIQTSLQQAGRFGVVEIDGQYRVTRFEEKPRHGRPDSSPFNPEVVSASMEDAADLHSSHDFGSDILPKFDLARPCGRL